MSLKAEISRFYLSFLWWILNPLLHMGVFYLVFETFLSRGTPNFALFLLCGLIHWEWFARSVLTSSGSLLAGKNILTQINLPKMFFPLECILKESFKFSISIFLLFLFLISNGFYPTVYWCYYPMMLVAQCVLNIGVGCFFASIVPLCEDLKPLVETFIRLLFFATGIFFPIFDIVSEKYRSLILLNPMVGLLVEYRKIFLDNSAPDWYYIFYALQLGIFFLLSALLLFSFFHARYAHKWHQ